MTSYNDKRILCRDSYTVARLIEQTIFEKITPETTPQMFTEALEHLTRLCERFEAQLDLFHYAATQDPITVSGTSMRTGEPDWKIYG
jgi:hypothetical protein